MNAHDVKANANAAMVRFLKLDLDMAMTFVDIAERAASNERAARCLSEARKAYDTVLRMINSVDLSNPERTELQKRLATLKSTLQRLGQSFDSK